MAFFDLVKGEGVIIPGHVSQRAWYAMSRRERPYDVTGISPQSITVAQLLKGFVSNGTL